ncbi:hypothetical protein GCM10010261_52820 [Streptomyces pilosus]|uniref:Uncharacterized protein n=1 Tax=Streptomyces pilosus TaxID=28893 RepID=A0A918C1B2_9ACTN|nr:hypothetical protein GCM10010280_55100 [Streptomyces pilosus]GGV63032.1 hypothetical protein GCM10010261_52820 [Streptomyces pilosus]
MFAMPRTLAGRGNTEDPVVGRRQGPGDTAMSGGRAYAAVVLVEPAEPDELDEPDDVLEPEPESEEDAEEEDEDAPADFDAGELLDEEPRLSLR